MSSIFSPSGLLILVFLLVGLHFAARSSWAGALSLPAMTLLTGIVYFFALPALFVLGGRDSFFGLGMEGLPTAQGAMALYMAGAGIAFFAGRAVWMREPGIAPPVAARVNPVAVALVLAAIFTAIGYKFYAGELSIAADAQAVDNELAGAKFLNLAFSALIGLTLYFLIMQRFSAVSLVLLALVLGLFLIDGFRFRMVILISGAALAYCYYRNFRPGLFAVGFAMVLGLFVFNVIGATRTYGRGVDLAAVEGQGFGDWVRAVGGEIGPVFVLSHLTQRPSDFILFDPWAIAIARFVPSALWPDKPFPEYLAVYPGGFPDPRAMTAGIAGTQQAEFYMQFGWFGLPVLAFLFFMLAIWTLNRLWLLSPQARLAGMTLIPGLFGFYAQQRGYAFQFLCEFMFTILPLFLIHIGGARAAQARLAH